MDNKHFPEKEAHPNPTPQEDVENDAPPMSSSDGDTPPVITEAQDADRFENIMEADDSWKKVKRPPKWSASKAMLMLCVLIIIPWVISGNRSNIAYFFSSSEALDLGDSSDYIRNSKNTQAKEQNFEDNRLVKISGFPVRQIAIKTKDGGLTHKTKLIYQLMGSGIYVEEPLENSKYAQFLSSTKTQFSQDAGVVAVQVEGRLRRFDTADANQYASVRDYYTNNYDVTFCNTLSENEKAKRRAQLGKGGLALQVMPDKSVLEGDTGTRATIKKVIPLKGRAALAITDTNERLTTKDAGKTWSLNKLAFDTPVSALAYAPQTGQVVYAARKGQISPENYHPEQPLMTLSQDVEDMLFNAPEHLVIEPGTEAPTDIPAMIAVGREGLVELAWQNREGWLPASLIQPPTYHGITRIDNTVYVVGTQGTLMERTLAPNTTWHYAVSPEQADWSGLQKDGNTLVAVGSKGKVIRRNIKTDDAWETWPFDDVPGIDFHATLKASAVSDDHKHWVGVGLDGAIVTATGNGDGTFGRFSALTNTYIGYGFVDDLASGVSPITAVARMTDRHTALDLQDVTWHNGVFYAVGEKGLLMTSENGHDWTKKTPFQTDKRLYAIRFVDDTHGYIGGEGGTLLVTSDAGKTWHTMKSPTKRSIFKIITDPSVKNIFIFAGAHGLWGYCYTADSRCFLRSKNQPDHYRALTLATDATKPNRMQLVAVGDNGCIDGIDDTLGPDATRSLAGTLPALPLDIAIAETPIPLKPGYAGGQLAFVASTQGRVFRSSDAGYTFVPNATGLTDDIMQIAMSEDGDRVYARSRAGEVAQAVHGFRTWKKLSFPNQAKIISAAVVGKTALFADRQCLYAVAPEDDAEPTAIVCFDDDTITRLVPISRTEVLIESPSGTLYHLSTASDAGLGKLPAPLPRPLSDEATPTPGEPSAPPAPTASPVPSKLLSCNAELWYSNGQTLYRMQADAWIPVLTSSEKVLDYVCDTSGLVAVSATETKPGLWTLEASRISTTGAEQLWSATMGFDLTHAHVARTRDGFWFVTAPSPNHPDFPLILLSRDGKKWSWRSDRTTDFMAIAQGTGSTVTVGANGTIMISHDMGKTWREIKTSTRQTLRDVCLSKDGTFGIAVGDAGTIYYTKSSINYWSRSTYKLTTDLTSCAIDETDGRFNVYIAGKDGLFYRATDRQLSQLELITSPSFENIESLATLQTGEVIAVGGNYQAPDTICEDGFILIDGQRPFDMWLTVLIHLLLACFWVYTLRTLYLAFIHRNDIDMEAEES